MWDMFSLLFLTIYIYTGIEPQKLGKYISIDKHDNESPGAKTNNVIKQSIEAF